LFLKAATLEDIDNFGKIRQNLPKLFDTFSIMKKILVLHGPNLNLLGTREPATYGATTLEQINARLIKEATQASVKLECYQSNAEADLIQVIHQASIDKVDYIIFNPAGFTHTSIALRDALTAVLIPFIEVHISNIHSREPFRHHSYFSDIAKGTISGFGAQGYSLALTSIIERESK
jgi:3-dehydroquinate dehydratase-2